MSITVNELLQKYISELNDIVKQPIDLLNIDITKLDAEALDRLSYIFDKVSFELDKYIESHNPITYFDVKCTVLATYGGANTDWSDTHKDDQYGTTYWFINNKTKQQVSLRVIENKIVEINSL